MNTHDLTRIISQCWELDSLPKIKDVSGNYYILMNKFQIYFWTHQQHQKEIRVYILHPQGDKLEIIHTFTGWCKQPDWTHWDRGAWDAAFDEACKIIETANTRVFKENEARVVERQKAEEQLRCDKINRFAALFK
jgi:hypothetical protein